MRSISLTMPIEMKLAHTLTASEASSGEESAAKAGVKAELICAWYCSRSMASSKSGSGALPNIRRTAPMILRPHMRNSETFDVDAEKAMRTTSAILDCSSVWAWLSPLVVTSLATRINMSLMQLIANVVTCHLSGSTWEVAGASLSCLAVPAKPATSSSSRSGRPLPWPLEDSSSPLGRALVIFRTAWKRASQGRVSLRHVWCIQLRIRFIMPS